MRNKGKVYPTTPSADSLSIFKLLPAAILALTAVLSLEEQEVLAYMITRSIKSSTTTTTPFSKNKKKKSSFNIHNPPLFHCECFHCYTIYWFKWDSSPNRELIHQAIEAFEDHLNNTQQQSKKKPKKRGKPQIPSPEFEPKEKSEQILNNATEDESQSQPPEDATVGVGGTETAVSHQKGLSLARRVLPDVLGLLNSRWWSLWSPNV
ncbi:hypothetical protein L6452_21354 [Arctium lappa]|uniref:Uncharacterized protein n=1 Tax=Arctium lappa TaxID=4217 RepID=A0ACB9BFV7_ARCLA|nr:hypothetical protein L6452_21354 [Arctium lappa]